VVIGGLEAGVEGVDVGVTELAENEVFVREGFNELDGVKVVELVYSLPDEESPGQLELPEKK
jgi:hypothetical protein